jgi:predicted DsbA family dithiol-disulfide isomerase
VLELLYWNQGHENSGWVTDDLLAGIAKEVGLDFGRVAERAASGTTAAAIERMAAQARRDRVDSTPTVLVGPTGGTTKRVENPLDKDAIVAAVAAAAER